MKHVAIILLGSVLSGCPAEQRIYIHNKSDVAISSAYPNPRLENVKIGPGGTRYIRIRTGMESCFRLSIGGESAKAYHLPETILAETKSTGYGGRLDAYNEYGLLHFRYEDGRWAQFEEIAECNGI